MISIICADYDKTLDVTTINSIKKGETLRCTVDKCKTTHPGEIKGGINMRDISKRDREVYEYIKNFIRQNGITPSMRDICRGMNINVATVCFHFNNLVDKGYIKQITRNGYTVKGMKYVDEDLEELQKEILEIMK